MEKTCIKCGEMKPEEGFARRGDKARNICRECFCLQRTEAKKRRNPDFATRAEAKAREKELGVRTCVKCGVEKSLSEFCSLKANKRLGVGSACRACAKARTHEWRERNPEKARATCRGWHKKNPEQSRINSKRSYDNLSEEAKARYKEKKEEWVEKNRDYIRARQRDYQKEHLADYARRARGYWASKVKGKPGWLTPIQLAQIEEFYEVCLAVNVQTGLKHEVDHIIPINGKTVCGLHVPWNLQILPSYENRSKSNKLLDKYL